MIGLKTTKFKDKFGKQCRIFQSHGTGRFKKSQLASIGKNVIFESGVKVFHPENVSIGNNVYIGHCTYLKGYHKNKLIIESNVWIGQGVFLHGGGGIYIDEGVGIGPFVKIITLEHTETDREVPILYTNQEYKQVIIEYGVDIGTGSVILPGVTIGRNSIIGAGAVVTKSVPPFSVAVGIPAKVIRSR